MSDAVAEVPEVPEEDPSSEALRVFSAVGFEVSLAARFISLSTIIELIAALPNATRRPETS
ncbi:hypothetical protein [Ensifer adhaerens]|uniref:hypothetical protein n=1 Tax=Ensifer adhaerens TaxID=106592 RepID=UPI003F85F8E9